MPAMCLPLEVLDRAVEQALHQAPSIEMRDEEGNVFRIYADIKAGTWTLFVIPKKAPDKACIGGNGDQFQRYPTNIGRPS